MLKNILNLGTSLSKVNQKKVNGGNGCEPYIPCEENEYYDYFYCACVPDQPNH